jgi:hypothetical protein
MDLYEVKDIIEQLEAGRKSKTNVDDLQDLLVHYYLKTNKVVSRMIDDELQKFDTMFDKKTDAK